MSYRGPSAFWKALIMTTSLRLMKVTQLHTHAIAMSQPRLLHNLKKMALLQTYKWPYLKVTRVPVLPRLQMKYISSEQPPTPTRHKCRPAWRQTRSICYETLFGMRLPKCHSSGARNVNLDMRSALFRSSIFGTRLPNMARVIIRWNA